MQNWEKSGSTDMDSSCQGIFGKWRRKYSRKEGCVFSNVEPFYGFSTKHTKAKLLQNHHWYNVPGKIPVTMGKIKVFPHQKSYRKG